jgi:indolepyruvate ferredoxin oxidoreductase beta subunit
MNQKKDITNILLCGVGGQGILTMAEVICLVAVKDGFHVKKSEVHGMAQRGGSVESHVRFGAEVFSPLIPFAQADYLVCLHPQEHERMKGFLKKNGTDLFEYFDKAKTISTNPKYLNSAMLGIAAACLQLKVESWENVFNIIFASKNLKENLEAFHEGHKIFRKGEQK